MLLDSNGRVSNDKSLVLNIFSLHHQQFHVDDDEVVQTKSKINDYRVRIRPKEENSTKILHFFAFGSRKTNLNTFSS